MMSDSPHSVPELFLTAIENPGAPDTGHARCHVAYDWDLTLGRKPSSAVSAADVVAFAKKVPVNGCLCIDLEPSAAEPDHFNFNLDRGMASVRKSCKRLGEMIGAVREAQPDLTISAIYAPFYRDLWASPKTNVARAMLVMSELAHKPDAVAFDLYRHEPDRITNPATGTRTWADDAHEITLRPMVQAAKSLGLPVHVFVSPFRAPYPGSPTPPPQIPLTLFRADLMRVGLELDPHAGDRIVLWAPRVKPGPKPNTSVPWPWDPSWDWHVCLPSVEKAVLG